MTPDIQGLKRIVPAVQTWHRKCSNSHPHCNKTLSKQETIDAGNAPLPSRCVEFQKLPGSSHLLFWLRETKGLSGKYLILSHLWNEVTKATSTTRDNYQRRVNGQPGSASDELESGPGWTLDQKLSDLFIDIGTLAVALGIKYVWIDSICIIQEDAIEWESEATMMASYYQNAWLTIAPTQTVANAGGFLRQTTLNPYSIPRISRLPYRNKEGQQDGYFYLQCLSGPTLRHEYEGNIVNCKLLNRGWVFQEWILSPRILCFSILMPFLLCAELPPQPLNGNIMTNPHIDGFEAKKDITSEKDPLLYGNPDFLQRVGHKHCLGLDLTASRAAVYSTWRKLVMMYSGLELTKFENDRIVALAGIAREIGLALSKKLVVLPDEAQTERGANYNNTYACGSWLGDIVRELQWEISDGLGRPPCRVRGFPTWSWLSLGCPTTDGTGQPTMGGARVLWPDLEFYSKSLHLGRGGFDRGRRMRGSMECVSLKAACVIPVGTEADGWPIDMRRRDEWKVLEPFGVNNDYGNRSRFITLCFRQAKVIQVQLGPRFDSSRPSSIAAKCTQHKSDGQTDHWRAVTLPISRGARADTQEIIHGWASLEHPEYQQPGRDPTEHRTFALRIAHLPEVNAMEAWFASYFHTAAIVLYIRQVQPGETGESAYFERLGIGRLFGPEIESEFAAAEEREIWLI